MITGCHSTASQALEDGDHDEAMGFVNVCKRALSGLRTQFMVANYGQIEFQQGYTITTCYSVLQHVATHVGPYSK